MQFTKILCTLVAVACYGTSSPAPDGNCSSASDNIALIQRQASVQAHSADPSPELTLGSGTTSELTNVESASAQTLGSGTRSELTNVESASAQSITSPNQAYAMIGLGACRDETRKWSRGALKVHNGAYTLAECQSFCDANPNCQGFTSDYGRQNRFCELWSDAYTANGDSEYQCWSKANLKAHEYAMVGLGACRDATGKWSKNALKANHASSWEPYTLADCQLQCDVTPNCQGFTADYGRQNRFCELWSDADTANGDSEYQCWSKGNLKVPPTQAPTPAPTTQAPTPAPTTQAPTSAPVYGNWNVKRMHATWNHLTRDDSVCGKNTDVLSIGSVSSKWCKNKHGSDGQAIVNQDGAELSFAWFCSNQGTTTIVGTPTFVPEEADGPCAHQHQVGDQGK